jgi:hypothetical protein
VTVKYTPSKGLVDDFIPYRSIISDSSCHEGERKRGHTGKHEDSDQLCAEHS